VNKKKNMALMVFFLAATICAQNGTPTCSDVCGVWLSEDNKGRIEMVMTDSVYKGALVQLAKPIDKNGKPRLDIHNPDSSLRSRPLLGITIISGLRCCGTGKFSGGNIYDPEFGKNYSCRLNLMTKDSLELRGFVGVSLFGKSTWWTRVK
jgi:uncharacterized protein (DUF2147 family)